MALKHLKIEVNNAVFSLPYHVALQEGYFRDGTSVGPRPRQGGARRAHPGSQGGEILRLHEGIERGEYAM